MSLNRFLGSSSDLICVDADASAPNASRPSPNSSTTSSIRTISLRDRARRSSVVTRPFPVQSQDFFHSSIERPYSCAPQTVGAVYDVYDRPGFFVQSREEGNLSCTSSHLAEVMNE